MNFTPEQLTKARATKSADELLAVAKEAGVSMTEEQAAKYFAELNKQGELTDDELAAIAGGGPKGEETPAAPEAYFYSGCCEQHVNLSDKPICPNDLGLNSCAECGGYDYPSSDMEYYYCTGFHMRK